MENLQNGDDGDASQTQAVFCDFEMLTSEIFGQHFERGNVENRPRAK